MAHSNLSFILHIKLTDLMSQSSFNNVPPSTSTIARCSRRYF